MILALAVGNPLRADDGAGRALAAGLAARLPGVEVIEAQELLPEHAELAARAQGVLFLDAALDGVPGEVRCAAVAPGAAQGALLHALGPEEVLGLAAALYGRAPPAVLVTVTGSDFSFGESLSAPVAAALPEARRVSLQAAGRLADGR